MKNKFLLATAAGISLMAVSEAGCTSCGNVNRNQQRSHQYNTMHRYNSFSHQGQEDHYITENDKQVLNQIRQILSEDQYRDLNIHATVEYGKVVLDGKTYSQGTKDDIQQQVASLQGVRYVIMDVYVDNRKRKNPNGSHSMNQQNGNQNNGSRSWWKSSDEDSQPNSQNGHNGKGSDPRDSNRERQNGRNKDTRKNGQSNGYDSQSYRQQNRNNSQSYYYEDYQKETGSYDQGKSRTGSMDQNDYANRDVSDSQLKSQIEKKLIGGWFDKSQIGVTVQVKNGIVTLSGKVDSHADKQSIASEIENMDGVQRVYNRIEIKQQGGNNRQDRNSPGNGYNNYHR